MKEMTATDIGKRLAEAFHMNCRPVCVFGTDHITDGAVALGKVDRCVARAIYTLSSKKDTPALYFGKEAREGVCGGGQGWPGFGPDASQAQVSDIHRQSGFHERSGGVPEGRARDGGEVLPRSRKITPPARFMTFAGYGQLTGNEKVLSWIFFGTGEQIRNLGGLIQFRSDDIFTSVLMPGGPSCASLVTYAAGMSEKAPRDSSYVGPVDPTGNAWFPENMMAMSIPMHVALRMAQDIDASFIGKRPEVAMPSRRLGFGEKGEHF